MAKIDESGLAYARIRDRPINGKLKRVLVAAADTAGVDVVSITSGGQPGSSGQSVGSRRHDGGNAADLELVRNGRTLNFTDGEDLETVCQFVAAAAAHGATGIGAGVDYMGPTRLHVGFGNGPGDQTRLVWGAQGLSANAPGWLNEAAARGWRLPAGGSITDESQFDIPTDGGSRGIDPGVAPPAPEVGAVGPLQAQIGALLRHTESLEGLFGAIARGGVALYQLVRGLPVDGVPDADAWRFMVRLAMLSRYIGWPLGAIGAIGVAKSLGGLTVDSYLQALDRLRAMLGDSADQSVNIIFDAIRRIAEAAKPALESAARSPPLDALLPWIVGFVPGPAMSVAALGLGIVLHQFGAKIIRRGV